jgi:hypothetical protein
MSMAQPWEEQHLRDEPDEGEWDRSPSRDSADDPEFRAYRPNFERRERYGGGPRFKPADDPALQDDRPAFARRRRGYGPMRPPRLDGGAPFDTGWPDDRPRLGDDDDAWRRPGRFTGYGPRGYQRADDRIREDICERLTYYGELDARDIEIDVSDGEVTLTGTVDDRPSKRVAERIAEAVSGVHDVHNQLQLRTHAFGREG